MTAPVARTVTYNYYGLSATYQVPDNYTITATYYRANGALVFQAQPSVQGQMGP
jgi:hypothetical protein